MKSSKLADVFNSIEEQTDFYFFYNRDQLNDQQIVSVDAENKKVEEVLDELFRGQDIAYKIDGRNILIEVKGTNHIRSEQQKTVSGRVTDSSGQPLPGVTVVVKGTTTGTITDSDGKYSLSNVSNDVTLVFSFVGMKSQEIAIEGKTNVNVALVEETVGIEEVVAIGYGTMKKSDLTGSVANIRGEDIQNRVATQTATLLQGELSGVTVMQGSGEPGKDGGTIRIRGMGTFSNAGNNPLVLVDGVPGSLNDVHPNDIKGVSVLKDASSAAIYGARAANGVILIETNRGSTGEMKIEYDGYIGVQKPTETIQLVDSWTYAELYNEAMVNEGKSPIYSQEAIAKYKSGEDPDNYPNFNGYKYLLDQGSGQQTEHNIRFSGGNERSRYWLSGNYLSQEAMMIEQSNVERYAIRMNMDSKISDKFDLNFNLHAKHVIQNAPNPAVTTLISNALKIPPTIPGKRSDGTYGHASGITMLGYLESESFSQQKENFFAGTINLTYKILDNFSITGLGSYRNSDNSVRTFAAEIILDKNAKISPNSLTVQRGNANYLTLQSFLKYNKSFKSHQFDLLAGYSQEENFNEWDSASRDNFPSNSLHQINAGSSANMKNNGTSNSWALQSFFGRVDYSFKEKYLVQLNARYDGSSRFPKGNRFDLFPSVSGGWRISEEQFFNVPFISDFKIRGSYGELGNQEVGLYPYQQTLVLGMAYPIGGVLQSGIAATTLSNRELSWETTKVTDAGFDIVLWNGKLSLTSDWFIKRTEGILYKITSSSVLGVTPTEQNAGIVENRGVDLQINYRGEIKDFSYRVAANLSHVRNKVVSLYNVDRDINQGLFVGEPITSIYGYVADGLFVDEADVTSYPTQPYIAKPGYIRLRDIGGPDGVPDGIVTAEYDRKIIGNEFPNYNFGLTFWANYKRFDFQIQWQGVAGIDNLLAGGDAQGLAFMNGSTPQSWMLENRWTPENPDRNAKYPRWETANDSHPHNRISTYWLRSAAFLRLNNLSVGYSFPVRRVADFRVYFSGSNLLTFDGYYEGYDPESDRWYPPAAVYTLGVKISF